MRPVCVMSSARLIVADIQQGAMNLRQRIFWRQFGTFLAFFVVATVILALLLSLLPGTLPPFFGRLLVAALALIVAGAASWQVAGRLHRGLDGLEQSLQRMAAGEHGGQLPPGSRQDFEELATAFERMSQQVRTHSRQMENDRDRLRTVLDGMVEGVVAVDATQRIMLINAAACRMLKLDQSALARPIWELVRHPRLQQWVAQALEKAEPVSGEIELLDPIPRIVVVNVVRFPLQPLPGAVIVLADVTELRRLERVRQEFVANASHELKTPLASIKACVETLLDGAVNDPGFRDKFLQTIDQQADRLDALVRDMLTLARVESDMFGGEYGAVPVQRVVQSCVARHTQAAERKQLTVVVELPERESLVRADEEGLEEIIDNLIDNAIKYTDAGGRIALNWQEREQQVVITVKDTGIGIPSNQLPRIFERFYRVDRHRSRDQGGTGLGLAIVKHLVQSMGGSISVQSGLHQGTAFQITLPRAVPANEQPELKAS